MGFRGLGFGFLSFEFCENVCRLQRRCLQDCPVYMLMISSDAEEDDDDDCDDDNDNDDDDDDDADDDENDGIRMNSIFVGSVPHWSQPPTNPRLCWWLETRDLLFEQFTARPAPRNLQCSPCDQQLFTTPPNPSGSHPRCPASLALAATRRAPSQRVTQLETLRTRPRPPLGAACT